VHVKAVADIGQHESRFAALFDDFLRKGARWRLKAVGEHEPVAGGGETARAGSPYSMRCAGDDNRSAGHNAILLFVKNDPLRTAVTGAGSS
jgi:hypothetical protein